MSSESKSTNNLGSESAQNGTISDLISLLRSAVPPSELDKVQQILVTREENMKRNLNDMSKEIEIWKKKFDFMEKKKGELELTKLEIEAELKKYKRECDELREQVTRFGEDQRVQCDRAGRVEERYAKLLEEFEKAEVGKRELVFQVKVKNTDLECANASKRRAEGEVEAWKKKFGELEFRVLRLEEDTAMLVKAEQPVSDEMMVEKETCDVDKPQNQTGARNSGHKESASNCHEEVQRECIKEKGTCDDGESQKGTVHGNSNEKGHVSASGQVIEIDGLQVAGLNSISWACDSERLIKKELESEVGRSDRLIGSSMGVNQKPESQVIIELSDSDDEITTVKEMTKRKRASCSNLYLSEDDDDKTLILKRKTKKLQPLINGEKTSSPVDSYRAMPDSGSIDIAKAVSPSRQRPVLIGRCQKKIKADETDSSDSEDSSCSGDKPDTDSDMNNMLTNLWKKRNMLSAFERDPELCMNAICALYRQQSSTKKSIKGPLHSENRGFNQFDANRVSTLAKFLINGDPQGRLKKSVVELQQYDPKGLDDCRRLATQYSTQLFQIYQRKEDPFFLPSLDKLSLV